MKEITVSEIKDNLFDVLKDKWALFIDYRNLYIFTLNARKVKTAGKLGD